MQVSDWLEMFPGAEEKLKEYGVDLETVSLIRAAAWVSITCEPEEIEHWNDVYMYTLLLLQEDVR